MSKVGRTCATAMMLALAAGACGQRRDFPADDQYVVPIDAYQDPGAHVAPTNDVSFQLLEAEPAGRRAWFGSAIAAAGKKCNFVTSAVLKAGDDGTDLWRVGCDNGAWLVTLAQGKTMVEICSSAPDPNCSDKLKPIRW